MKDLKPIAENYKVGAGETAAQVALRKYGDATRFREVLDANKDQIDPQAVFGFLKSQLNLKIPNLAALTREPPILGEIAKTTNKARALVQEGREFLAQGQAIVGQLGGVLPSGYTKAALDALGEVNGVLDQAESVLDQANPDVLLNKLRDYDTQLIDWLLS